LRRAGLSWEDRSALLLRPNDDPGQGPPRLAHLKARDYVAHGYISQKAFDAAFKFAYVRNPWARMISIYHHLSATRSFRAYVLGEFRQKVWREMAWFVGPQSDFIYDEDGRLLVDFVGRFERLQADFDVICRRLGMSPEPLPHVNHAAAHRRIYLGPNPRKLLRSWRKRLTKPAPRHARYQDYYDADTRALVAEIP